MSTLPPSGHVSGEGMLKDGRQSHRVREDDESEFRWVEIGGLLGGDGLQHEGCMRRRVERRTEVERGTGIASVMDEKYAFRIGTVHRKNTCVIGREESPPSMRTWQRLKP